MYEWELLLVGCKESECLLEIGETCLCECSVAEKIMDRVHPALEWEKWRIVDPARVGAQFRFTFAWITLASLALFFGFAFISRGTTKFIYFNF